MFDIELERGRHTRDLQLRINGRGRKELELQGLQLRIVITGKALAIRFFYFRGIIDQLRRETGKARIETVEVLFFGARGGFLFGVGDLASRRYPTRPSTADSP